MGMRNTQASLYLADMYEVSHPKMTAQQIADGMIKKTSVGGEEQKNAALTGISSLLNQYRNRGDKENTSLYTKAYKLVAKHFGVNPDID